MPSLSNDHYRREQITMHFAAPHLICDIIFIDMKYLPDSSLIRYTSLCFIVNVILIYTIPFLSWKKSDLRMFNLLNNQLDFPMVNPIMYMYNIIDNDISKISFRSYRAYRLEGYIPCNVYSSIITNIIICNFIYILIVLLERSTTHFNITRI